MAFGRGEVGNILEQRGMAVGADFGIAEFAGLAGGFGGHHLAAQLLGHGLHAVADAEDRDAQLENDLRCARRIAFGDRVGAAGQDDALGAVIADEFVGNVVRVNLAEDLGFAHAAGDQLGNLGTEIENEDFLVGHGSNPGNGELE